MSTVVLTIPVTDPALSRPLSSISTSEIIGSSKPLPSRPPQPNYVPSGSPSTFRASLAVPPSASMRLRPGSLGSVLQEPRILARFLRYVRWYDFQSLAFTCRACCSVLHHPKLRDGVLSRFVPGYRYCRSHADVDAISGIVDVQFSDLSHFMASQQLPLHHYPTLALTTFSPSSSNTAALEEKIQRLVLLCQAHSRMILLLQALIHSAPSSVREEPDNPSLRYRNPAQQGGRELVFPAPLSFAKNDGDKKAKAPTPPRGHFRFFSMPSSFGRTARASKGDLSRRSSSLLSILRRSAVPPPPPSADPLGLKIYAGSWRGRNRTSTVPSQASEYDFQRPKYNSVSRPDSSGSSTVNSPLPRSPRPAEHLPIIVTMPHDIGAATSRQRAPILRVFFPCSKVDHRTIAACEAQLDDAGLWQHLSVGDIICNLGYLPSSDVVDPSDDDTPSPESWMVFDGTVLVPYAPSAVLPIPEPLSLPSPFYYAHITPPPVNPRFIAALPRGEPEPELSLVLLPRRVRSPHSANGSAQIKKYEWLARLRPHVRHGLGEGWHGEWILEGEGTKEGRQSLLDALGVKREWELVMERSTPTRIWLRLISPSPLKDIGFY